MCDVDTGNVFFNHASMKDTSVAFMSETQVNFLISKRTQVDHLVHLYLTMADPRSQLLGVLHEATSQDLARIRQAEQLLKQWENEPHFFATLQVRLPVSSFNNI